MANYGSAPNETWASAREALQHNVLPCRSETAIDNKREATFFVVSSEGCLAPNALRYFAVINQHTLDNAGEILEFFFKTVDVATSQVKDVFVRMTVQRSDPRIVRHGPRADIALIDITDAVPLLRQQGAYVRPIPYKQIVMDLEWQPTVDTAVYSIRMDFAADCPAETLVFDAGTFLPDVISEDGTRVVSGQVSWLSTLFGEHGNSGGPIFCSLGGNLKLAGVVCGGVILTEQERQRLGHAGLAVHGCQLRELIFRCVAERVT